MPTDFESNYSYPNHFDISFQLYWQQFREAFKWRGAYLFLRVDDEVAIQRGRPTSLEQVDLFVNELYRLGLYDDDYVVLDVEQTFSQLEYLSAEKIGKRVKDVVLKTESLTGRKPIIYTGTWWWEYYHQGFDNDFFRQYPFWLSHYWPIDANNQIQNTGTIFYIKDIGWTISKKGLLIADFLCLTACLP